MCVLVNRLFVIFLLFFVVCSCSPNKNEKVSEDKSILNVEVGTISQEKVIGYLDFLPSSEENMKFGFDATLNLVDLLKKETQLDEETIKDISYKFRQDSDGMRLILVCKGKATPHFEKIANVLEKDFERRKAEKLESL